MFDNVIMGFDYIYIGFFLLFIVMIDLVIDNDKFLFGFLTLVLLSIVVLRWAEIDHLIGRLTGRTQ